MNVFSLITFTDNIGKILHYISSVKRVGNYQKRILPVIKQQFRGRRNTYGKAAFPISIKTSRFYRISLDIHQHRYYCVRVRICRAIVHFEMNKPIPRILPASALIIRNVVRFIQLKFCFRFSVSHYML